MARACHSLLVAGSSRWIWRSRGLEFGGRGGGVGAGREAGDGAAVVIGAVGRGWVCLEGEPEVGAVREMKAGGHDSHNAVAGVGSSDLLSGGRGVGAEPRAPELLADHGDAGSVRSAVAAVNGAAEERGYAESGKNAVGDVGARDEGCAAGQYDAGAALIVEADIG